MIRKSFFIKRLNNEFIKKIKKNILFNIFLCISFYFLFFNSLLFTIGQFFIHLYTSCCYLFIFCCMLAYFLFVLLLMGGEVHCKRHILLLSGFYLVFILQSYKTSVNIFADANGPVAHP